MLDSGPLADRLYYLQDRVRRIMDDLFRVIDDGKRSEGSDAPLHLTTLPAVGEALDDAWRGLLSAWKQAEETRKTKVDSK